MLQPDWLFDQYILTFNGQCSCFQTNFHSLTHFCSFRAHSEEVDDNFVCLFAHKKTRTCLSWPVGPTPSPFTSQTLLEPSRHTEGLGVHRLFLQYSFRHLKFLSFCPQSDNDHFSQPNRFQGLREPVEHKVLELDSPLMKLVLSVLKSGRLENEV